MKLLDFSLSIPYRRSFEITILGSITPQFKIRNLVIGDLNGIFRSLLVSTLNIDYNEYLRFFKIRKKDIDFIDTTKFLMF